MAEEIKSAEKGTANNTKIWQLAAIILGIALIASLAFFVPQVVTGGVKAVNADQAGGELVDFINKIYGPQLGGNVTLDEIVSENGLYKVSLTIQGTEQPQQVVYMTRDGEFFIPQAINIEEVLQQYEAYQAQLNQQPPTTETNTNTSTTTNTNEAGE